MNPMIEDHIMPVFLINGFLESGKTTFLSFTMEQDYFQIDGKTLLIVCEEGDTEYDPKLLKEMQVSVVYAERAADVTPEWLLDLGLMYNPERVVIEWNGMWDQGTLTLPADWIIYQQITLIDMATFDRYAKNMKPLLAAMVKHSELVIGNRCDGILDLNTYKRMIKSMNTRCQTIFEDSLGEVPELTEDGVPYDLEAKVVQIEPEDYGIWYIDCMDRPERYQGKMVEFTAMALKSPNFPKNYFVPGRMAMTCCADDMTFLGYVCKAREARQLETGQWIRVRARVEIEYWPDYEGEGPVLYAEEVKPAEEIREVVGF